MTILYCLKPCIFRLVFAVISPHLFKAFFSIPPVKRDFLYQHFINRPLYFHGDHADFSIIISSNSTFYNENPLFYRIR